MTDTKQLVNRYAEIEKTIEAMEVEKKDIKIALHKEMTDVGAEQIKSEVGMFYFRTAKKWSYPESISALEASVKEIIKPFQEEIKEIVKPLEEKIEIELQKVVSAKKEAEEIGTATVEETKSLAFKAS